MSTPPLPTTPVTTDPELTERWRTLLGTDGVPTRRTLFLSWLRADGTSVPMLIPVEDMPAEPDRQAIDGLVRIHDVVAESEGVPAAGLHLAMCLERRGPAGLSPEDAAWAAAVDSVVRGRDGLDCSLSVSDGRRLFSVLPRQSWSR